MDGKDRPTSATHQTVRFAKTAKTTADSTVTVCVCVCVSVKHVHPS